MSLGIGKSALYNDYWDAMFTSSYSSELYYSSGTSTVTTSASLKITRTGFFTYDVQGTITNYWHDRYNWEPGASAYLPGVGFVPDDFGLSLQEAGRGKSFLMHSTEKIKITEKNNFIMP